MKPQLLTQSFNTTVVKLRTLLGGIAILACAFPPVLSAQAISWDLAGNGNWETPGNWNPSGPPSSTSDVSISNGQHTVNLTDASNPSWMTVNSLTVGATGTTGSRLILNYAGSETFTVGSGVSHGAVQIGSAANATGRLTVTNGNFSALTVTLGGGGVNTSVGTWNIDSGLNTIRATTGFGLTLGSLGRGTVNLTGGQLDVLTSAIAIGSNGFQQSAMNISGGALNAHSIFVAQGTHVNQVLNSLNVSGGTTTVTSQFTLGRQGNSNGQMTMTGGVFDASSAVTYIGKREAASANLAQGNLTISDGTLSLGTTYVGWNSASAGTYNINGGTNTVTGNLDVGFNAGSTGNVTMTGGTLAVSSNMRVGVNGTGSFTLNDGSVNVNSLQATNGASSTITFNGGTITTNGTNINNGSVFTVGNGTSASTLILNGGSHAFANGLTLANNATLGGTGTITSGALVVSSGSTLSPGNSPGALTVGDTTLHGGANLNWQVFDASGSAGTGYDVLYLTPGSVLTLANTSMDPFNINLWSLSSIDPDVEGDALNFDSLLNYSWTLIETDQLISGFSADKFVVNVDAYNGTSGFSNLLDGGVFSVALADGGTNLVLNFTAIPEPSTFALMMAMLGITATVVVRRRRSLRIKLS